MEKITNESLGATHTGSLKENKKKNIKGITLVALVVTIIILLILAGISISVLTQTGLFEKAKLAKKKQENAQIKENETLGDYENEIGEYVKKSTRNSETWTKIYQGTPTQCLDKDFSKYEEIRICFLLINTEKQYSEWNYYTVNRLDNADSGSDLAFKVTMMNHPNAYISIYFKKVNNKFSYSFKESAYFNTSSFDILIEGK